MSIPITDTIQAGRRRLAFALPLLACSLVIPPVQAKTDIHQSSHTLMGTRVDLTLQGKDSVLLAVAAKAAYAEMARLENMMSRYNNTSVLQAINLSAGIQAVAVPPEMLEVLLMAHQAAVSSNGDFDITIGALRDWDFSPGHQSMPSAQQIATQLPLVHHQQLLINTHASTAYLRQRGMQLDLGGIAKLPILQAGMQCLRNAGVQHAMINGGGDVLVNGQINGHPWRIGLRDPRQPAQLLGMVGLERGFVAASGDYERFFMHEGQRLHHILDPKTGYPSQGPHGVTLISEDLHAINGLGAAIMVSGSHNGRMRLEKMPGTDALIVGADQQIWMSPGMKNRLLRA